MVSRRKFLGFLAAPAIIRVADLMPIKPAREDYEVLWNGYLVPKTCLSIHGLHDHFHWLDRDGYICRIDRLPSGSPGFVSTGEKLPHSFDSGGISIATYDAPIHRLTQPLALT